MIISQNDTKRAVLRYIGRLILNPLLLIACCTQGQLAYTEAKYTLAGIVPENQVRDIVKDQNGFYWILTTKGWLIRWDGVHFKLVNESKNSYRYKQFLRDNKGGVIIQTTGLTYDYVDKESKLQPVTENNTAIPHDPIFSFVRLQQGMQEIKSKNDAFIVAQFLRGYNQQVARFFSISNDEFYQYHFRSPDTFSFLYYNRGVLTDLHLKNNWAHNAWLCGKYLVSLNGGQYNIYYRDKLVAGGYNDDPLLKKFLLSVNPTQITDSALFIADQGSIYKLSLDGTRLIVKKYFDSPGKENIGLFFCDEGRQQVYISSLNGGFSMYEKNVFYSRKISDSANRNIVYTLLYTNNRLYTNQDFRNKITAKQYDYAFVSPFVAINPDNILYPAIEMTKLFGANLSEKKTWPWAGKQVKYIVQHDRAVYMSDGKLSVFDNAGHTIKEIPLIPALETTEHTGCIVKGPGNIIFAAINKSIVSVDVLTGRRKELAPFPVSEIRGLTYDPVINGVFVTTSETGFYFLDLATGKLLPFPVGEYRQLLSCHYVMRDRDGDYWMPTNSGLFLMKKEQAISFINGKTDNISYYKFGAEHGIINEEFNGGFSNCGLSIGDSIYMASMGGVICFAPREVKNKLKAAGMGKILLNHISVDDSLQVAGAAIRLPAGFKRCIFQFSFPFINMPSARLEYRLEGLKDISWAPLSEMNEVMLRGLSPGKYTLQVRVRNRADVEPLSFPITAAQYWYKTKFAYAVYLFLLITVFYLVANWQIHRAQNKSLREIDRNRRELFTIISHDLRSPLKAYQGLAEIISYLIRKKDYESIEGVAAQIDSTGVKLDLLMNNLLKWNLLQQEKLGVKNEKLNLAAIVAEHAAIYQEVAVLKQIHISIPDEQWAEIEADGEMVSLMVRNLLDNAIKNSPRQKDIQAAIHNKNEEVVLRISNAIRKDDEEKLEKISHLIQSEKPWEPGAEGMGIGLRMVYLAAQKTGAKLNIAITGERVEFSVCFRTPALRAV